MTNFSTKWKNFKQINKFKDEITNWNLRVGHTILYNLNYVLDWKNNSKSSKIARFKKKAETAAKTKVKKIGLYISARILPLSASIHLFKVTNRNTKKRCEVCSRLTIITPEWCHWSRANVFIANFEHILHLFLVFLLLTLNKWC